jgi:hypothetical protein
MAEPDPEGMIGTGTCQDVSPLLARLASAACLICGGCVVLRPRERADWLYCILPLRLGKEPNSSEMAVVVD